MIAVGDLTLASNNATGNLQINNQAIGRVQSDAAIAIVGYGSTPNSAANNAVSLNNFSGATLLGDSFAFNGLSFINAGDLQGTRTSSISSNTLQNSGKLIVSAMNTGDGTLSAVNLTNTGTLKSARHLNVNVGSNLQNSGSILAAGDVRAVFSSLTAPSLTLSNTGLIQADGALSLTGGRLLDIQNGDYNQNKNVGKLIGGTINMLAGDFINGGTVHAVNGSSIDVETLGNKNHLQNAVMQLSTSTAGSGVISASNWLDNGSIITSMGTLTMTAFDLSNGAEVPINNAQGTLFAAGDITLHVSNALDNYGLILTSSGSGTSGITIDGGADVWNHTVYKSNTIPVDSVGEILSYGSKGISITANTVTNEGYLEANGINGDITINAENFTNTTVAPSVVTLPIGQGGGVVRSSIVWMGFDYSQQLIDDQNARINQGVLTGPTIQRGNTDTFDIDERPAPFPNPRPKAAWLYYLFPTDPFDPSSYNAQNYIYRDWTGQVYCCKAYSRAPLVAHTTAVRDIILNANSNVINHGAQINTGRDLTVNSNGRVDYVPHFINEGLDLQEDIYTAHGRAKYVIANNFWDNAGKRINDLAPVNFADYYITTGSSPAEAVTMVPGVINVGRTFNLQTIGYVTQRNQRIVASVLTSTVPNGSAPGINGSQPLPCCGASRFDGFELEFANESKWFVYR